MLTQEPVRVNINQIIITIIIKMVNSVFVKILNQQGWYYDEKGQLCNTAIIE